MHLPHNWKFNNEFRRPRKRRFLVVISGSLHVGRATSSSVAACGSCMFAMHAALAAHVLVLRMPSCRCIHVHAGLSSTDAQCGLWLRVRGRGMLNLTSTMLSARASHHRLQAPRVSNKIEVYRKTLLALSHRCPFRKSAAACILMCGMLAVTRAPLVLQD